MLAYLVRRLGGFFATVLMLSLLVFYGLNMVPGDFVHVMVGQAPVSAEEIQELERFYGLDKPVMVRYLSWLANILRGDWGLSMHDGRPVLPSILAHAPLTLELAALSLLLALITGIPAGIVSALFHETPMDEACRIVSFLGLSVPHFWLGAMLLVIVSQWFGWFPPMGFVSPWSDPAKNAASMLLPVLALSPGVAAEIIRMLRTSLLGVLGQDYVRTARAKGLGEVAVLSRHALRNAMIPLITIIALRTGYLLAGSIMVEHVFSLPGMGSLLLRAVFRRDYPLIQGTVLFIAGAFASMSLAADILYAYADPRIRLER